MSCTNWVILSYGCRDIVSIVVTIVSQCHCERNLLWFQKRGFSSKAEWREEGTTVTISPCEQVSEMPQRVLNLMCESISGSPRQKMRKQTS